MELDEVLRRRRMVRHFTDQPVTPDQVDALVAAALRAPSAGFAQGVRLLVLTDAADRLALWEASVWEPPPGRAEVAARLREAPLLIVPLCSEAAYTARYAEPDKAGTAGGWAVPYRWVDGAFASMLVLLKAVDLGLGALFMAAEPGWVPRFRTAFGVPDEWDPVGVILVGHRHPDVGPAHRPDRRLPPDQVAFHGRWGAPRETRS